MYIKSVEIIDIYPGAPRDVSSDVSSPSKCGCARSWSSSALPSPRGRYVTEPELPGLQAWWRSGPPPPPAHQACVAEPRPVIPNEPGRLCPARLVRTGPATPAWRHPPSFLRLIGSVIGYVHLSFGLFEVLDTFIRLCRDLSDQRFRVSSDPVSGPVRAPCLRPRQMPKNRRRNAECGD